jgi:hypothetical protein
MCKVNGSFSISEAPRAAAFMTGLFALLRPDEFLYMPLLYVLHGVKPPRSR